MEVSPGFGEQMDRIILACHSGATERVLSSVVTKQLWLHPRGALPPPPATAERETRSSRKSSSRSHARVKREPSSSSSSSRMATRASVESPAMHTRSARLLPDARGSGHDAQPVGKRPRRAARKVIHDSSEDEDEGEEEKPVKKARKARRQQEQEDDDDELLSFKDAIGELCYPDRRTPSETKFFKERLRKSIQFVDALLCKPPPGKVCGRGCKKIRAQMCSSSTPCKNKMCRIWHDVEAHTDRCQNPQCEFKNRILLRETMHKLDMKEQQIAALKTELESKRAGLKEAADSDKEELENEIASLEQDLEECDSEFGVLGVTKKTFWSNLNEIGIEVSDDVADNFPDFTLHYEDKKVPRKARKDGGDATAHLSSTSSRGSRAAARREGSGPHGGGAGDDDDDEDGADAENADDNIPRRTTRRSTSRARHSVPSHNESDEETKGGDEETKEGDSRADRNGRVTPPDEPPLPPAGPPPFRQNPELDRAFAATASGYSIHPPADDLEAPAVAMDPENPVIHVDQETPAVTADQETPAVALNQETPAVTEDYEPPKQAEATEVSETSELQQLVDDAQQASDDISGIMAGFSANPPPVGPINTTGFTIRGNPPPNP
ncbi:unnamed protein product [Phytophthora fragariaefolia]|uniref:Unnamed protein product n=1 Tax=Phytophthora fragariaefolia TaxID=1490495 RepID=A0A9W7CRB9_9STRA|nr:unnamed protein product [Phytophthora fragariaefolia]